MKLVTTQGNTSNHHFLGMNTKRVIDKRVGKGYAFNKATYEMFTEKVKTISSFSPCAQTPNEVVSVSYVGLPL